MIRPLALTALLALTVVACSRGSSPSMALESPLPVHSSPLAALTTPPAAQRTTPPAQSSAETTTEDRTDAALEHLAALPADQQLPGGRWEAGKNYTPIVPAQPTNVAAGKVEVVEVFWYACPHCYALEPFIQSWLASKPAYIEFVRVPVMWGPVHRAHARLFYTLEALQRPDLHKKAFEAIHEQHNMLVANDDAQTLNMQVAFAEANGITADAFMKAYNSFTVSSNLQRADDLTQRYHVEGVPLMVVNGKYSTDVAKAGGQNELMALINDLAATAKRR